MDFGIWTVLEETQVNRYQIDLHCDLLLGTNSGGRVKSVLVNEAKAKRQSPDGGGGGVYVCGPFWIISAMYQFYY